MALIAISAIAALAPPRAQAIVHNADVAALVADTGHARPKLTLTLDQLTGEAPAPIGAGFFTFLTRSASSGTPIDKAEQYVYERLLDDGLDSVTYQDYAATPDGRNVIGEITGATRPNEVVIVSAHLDDTAKPDPGHAPGADDDGSGVAALLYLSEALAGHRFERTVRFVFFDGEECGYLGSRAYTTALGSGGENVVAVIDADMIGWDGSRSHTVELHTRARGRGDHDLWIARRYREAVAKYGITGITPRVLKDGADWSDHARFWEHGYGATCLIENITEHWNPYYHSADDTVAHLSWHYYVRVTQGLVATVAHLGYLQGTAADGDIYVCRIGMSRFQNGDRIGARATVTVYDSTLTPVQGASVSGDFSGAAASSPSAVTDSCGRARLKSIALPNGGTWTFTLGDVTCPGWTYDPSRDRRTTGTITVH